MRCLIFLLLFSSLSYGQLFLGNVQQSDTLTLVDTTLIVIDSSICEERGHVLNTGFSTLMWCEPYILDEEDVSYRIYPACNSTSGVCERCGQLITIPGEEGKEVIWRREEDKERIRVDFNGNLIIDK